MQLAAIQNAQPLWDASEAYVGMEVQAVGFEHGKENPGVVIYATKGSARDFRKLPVEVNGVSVTIRKIGGVNIKPELAHGNTGQPHVFERMKRIACGSSCAPAGAEYAGTFGAIVSRNGQLFALSNNHVFGACNHTPVNMPILAPANVDAAPQLRSPGEIARHSEIVPLRSGDPELVHPCVEDVAIGLIPDPSKVSSWQGDDQGYDTPSAILSPSAGLKVMKTGRTTGKSFGTVEALIDEPTPIPCQTKYFKGTVWFKNMWYVMGDGPHFALPGDSGSLVVSEDAKYAVGVLFSSNKTGDYGLMMPISHVLSLFGGISLVAQHGI